MWEIRGGGGVKYCHSEKYASHGPEIHGGPGRECLLVVTIDMFCRCHCDVDGTNIERGLVHR